MEDEGSRRTQEARSFGLCQPFAWEESEIMQIKHFYYN